MRSSGDNIGAKIIHVAFAPPGLGAKIARKAIGGHPRNGFQVHHHDKESAARQLLQFEICCPKTELAVNEFCGIRKSFEAGCGIRILAMANFAT
jgi:hypothetical protein